LAPPKSDMGKELPRPHFLNQHLFSTDFLDREFPKLPEWQTAGKARALVPRVRAVYEAAGSLAEKGGEPTIETNLVNPILALINPFYLPKESLRTGQIPDYVFFPDAESKVSGNHAGIIAVADAKEPSKDFDRAGGEKRSPTRQVYDYLVDSQTRWGFVTDGSRWRLLNRDSSTDRYLEIDLRAAIFAHDEETWLRFYYLFRREAFLLHREGSFLDRLKTLSDQHAVEISEGLKERVYQALLELASGLASRPENKLDAKNDATREALRQSCFVLLYRLLFVLYAEARGLLPVDREEYKRYSLKLIRRKAREVAQRRTLTIEGDGGLWRSLVELFRIINEGDSRLGVTAYNGGLFATEPSKVGLAGFRLGGLKIDDEHLARAIELLGFQPSPEAHDELVEVDYSRLEIRHLGSIYEGLLEFHLAYASENLVSVRIDQEERWVPESTLPAARIDAPDVKVTAGSLYLETEAHERKASGSYYTPEAIVKYIVRATLKPLIEKQLAEAKSRGHTPIESLLSLKVCDPAMGSGHFLVETTEFLADSLLTAAESTPEVGPQSPQQLNLTWAKREVLRHCIYGVDLNPLAVELAKVSLWLTTVDPERPLSFLDNRLKCGNSLVGVSLRDMAWPPGKRPKNVAAPLDVPKKLVDELLSQVVSVEATPEDSVRDVKDKENAFKAFLASPSYQRFKALGDIHTGLFFSQHDEKSVKTQYVSTAREIVFGSLPEKEAALEVAWARDAEAWAQKKSAFHWNIEFPEATVDPTRGPSPGFDAVVGNPPYIRAEEQDKLVRLYVQENPFYNHVSGRFDLSIPFIEAGLRLLRAGGRFGMILPDSVLTTNYAKKVRRWVLEDLSLDTVVDFGDLKVFGPKVGIRNCILIVQASAPQENWSVDFSTPRDISALGQDSRRLPREMFLISKDAALRSGLSTGSLALKDGIDKGSIPLSRICYCITGVVAHDSKTGASKDRLISPSQVDKWSRPYVEAKEWSGRYSWIEPVRFIEYRPDIPGHMHRSKFPELFSSPKILIQGITKGTLIATLDTQGIVCNHSLNCCVKLESVWHLGRKRLHLPDTGRSAAKPDPRYNLHYVLAVISSRLVGWYHTNFLGSKKGVMPQTVGQLPIHVIDFDSAAGVDPTPHLTKLRSTIGNLQNQPRVIGQLPGGLRTRVLHDFLAESARRMIENHRSIQSERRAFLDWLRSELRTDPKAMAGRRSIEEYEEMSPEDLIDLLKRNQAEFPEGVHTGSRAFQDRLRAEFIESRARLLPLKAENSQIDAAVDSAVFALYGILEADVASAPTESS
jgi:type I restriction-modification system DNA methylase subunit